MKNLDVFIFSSGKDFLLVATTSLFVALLRKSWWKNEKILRLLEKIKKILGIYRINCRFSYFSCISLRIFLFSNGMMKIFHFFIKTDPVLEFCCLFFIMVRISYLMKKWKVINSTGSSSFQHFYGFVPFSLYAVFVVDFLCIE